MSNTTPPSVEFLGGINLQEHFGAQYSAYQSRHLIDRLGRLGVRQGYLNITEQHLNDIVVVIADGNNDECAMPSSGLSHAEPSLGKSELTLMKVPDVLYQADDGSRKKKSTHWQRVLIATKGEVETKATRIEQAAQSLNLDLNLDNDRLIETGIDWIFAEEAVTALASSYHMQRMFGKYWPDFNGTSPAVRAERSLSAAYLRSLSDDEQPEEQNVAADYMQLKEGFGMTVLQERLLVRGVARRAIHADWIVQHLRGQNPAALSVEGIEARFRALEIDEKSAERYSNGTFKDQKPKN